MEKTNALAKISAKDLSKVEVNSLNTKQLNFLLSKTPSQHIYKRPAKGGGEWSYVTGTYVKKVLNLMFGWNWSFEVKEYKMDLNVGQAYVLGRLTVNSNGCTIVKEQFGRVDIKFKTEWIGGKKNATDKPLDIGNDLKAATTDALKKCASELGIASDVYAPNEFKAIEVIPETDLKADILILLNDNHTLNETDRNSIQRILDNEETESYHKVLTILNRLKDEG